MWSNFSAQMPHKIPRQDKNSADVILKKKYMKMKLKIEPGTNKYIVKATTIPTNNFSWSYHQENKRVSTLFQKLVA